MQQNIDEEGTKSESETLERVETIRHEMILDELH